MHDCHNLFKPRQVLHITVSILDNLPDVRNTETSNNVPQSNFFLLHHFISNLFPGLDRTTGKLGALATVLSAIPCPTRLALLEVGNKFKSSRPS